MMNGVKETLRLSMGLEASSIGDSTVEQAIRVRMAQIGARTTDDYLLRLRDSPAELDELIESVVVPESWFFRDGAPFTALANWMREHWLPTHPTGTLRLLTVPCSTGEEPYSVAMALLDAGLPPERFTVDAVDISRRALARAQWGVYGPNSFRGQALDFRDRHFSPGPDGYTLAGEVKRQVRFESGNILANNFRPGAGRFDVIFCRNLLIYFDKPTQIQAVQTLAGMLSSDGLLFVGHAESGIATAAGFTTANYPMAFAFRKTTTPPLPGGSRPPFTTVLQGGANHRPKRLAAPTATQPVPFFTSRTLAPDMVAKQVGMAVPAVREPSPLRDADQRPAPKRGRLGRPSLPAAQTSLDAARALADEGKLAEAARLCEDGLRQDGASAEAWYLLGVVRDAAGDHRRAAECYSKTLYLEPEHEEALLHRALLAERSGDAATAAQFRRRLVRAQGKAPRP